MIKRILIQVNCFKLNFVSYSKIFHPGGFYLQDSLPASLQLLMGLTGL